MKSSVLQPAFEPSSAIYLSKVRFFSSWIYEFSLNSLSHTAAYTASYTASSTLTLHLLLCCINLHVSESDQRFVFFQAWTVDWKLISRSFLL